MHSVSRIAFRTLATKSAEDIKLPVTTVAVVAVHLSRVHRQAR
jgi:hypothetical protein